MATKKTEDVIAAAEVEKGVTSHAAESAKVISTYAAMSAGFGLVPFPIIDVVAIAGTQYKMIAELARIHDVDASKERVRSAVISVLGGGVPTLLNATMLNSLVKGVPVVGAFLGLALLPAMAGVTTAALGSVFAQHFEAGGTLLSLDAKVIRAHFQAEFEALKEKASKKPAAAVNDAELVAA